MGAPVGVPALVELPETLKLLEPQLTDVSAGVGHATVYISNCSEQRENMAFCDEPGNKERFARLAVLYGWCHPGDHQFIYATHAPRLVHSVDHGHFFPNGPGWQAHDLEHACEPRPDAVITGCCAIPVAMIEAAAAALKTVDDATIVKAVAMPPDEWGLSMDERVALVNYFVTRRDRFSW